jgi:alpha-mannosidase
MNRQEPGKPTVAIVIPTTHWDRAWYWPFERFRVKLIDLFQVVKDLWERYPDYRFAIDGQCVPVEDYLDAVPEDRALLRRMGSAGRFTMGPLYVQPDLYCTGGESFIRNMLWGASVASEFNALQKVVYLPDTFGHTPEIPMLVSGFGYSTYVFMRGMPKGFPEQERFFRWRSADGSSVNVFRLRDGYANAARLGLHRGTGEVFDKKSSGIRPSFRMELAVEQLRKAIARQVDGQGEPHVLLAGVDHQIPQRELVDTMRQCESDTVQLRLGDWNDVEESLRQRDWGDAFEYQGEFHGTGASSVLGGTVSTRVYLKQDNAAAERALVCVAEPAEAVARLLGVVDPAGRALHVAWRRLLKAHPHDDITGCSVDTVHRETHGHIVAARQAADAVRRRMAQHLIDHFGGQNNGDERYAFFAYDTQAAPRRTRIVLQADFEGRYNWGDTPLPKCYDIVDEAGQPVPFRERCRRRSTEHPHPVAFVELAPRLEPFTFQRFFFVARPSWQSAVNTSRTIENDRLAATLNANGSVDLLDKKTGKTWPQLGLFSDQADCGDEYTFSHIRSDRERLYAGARLARVAVRAHNGMQVLACRGQLGVPVESTPAGRSRKLARLSVEVEYSLAPDENHLNCRIRFTNNACDHRLRWNLSLPFVPRETRAGLKFHEVKRAAGRRLSVGKQGYGIDPEHPADHFVAAERGKSGLAVFAQFPLNYELMREPQPRLAVALLRAVGMLSRSDMLTRGGGAGPDTPTPDAQCLRAFDMTFALRPYDVAAEGDQLLAEAATWRWEAVTGLILGCDPPVQDVPHGPLVEAVGNGIVVSALKRSQDGKRVVLRLHNASPKAVEAHVSVAVPGLSVIALGLNEEPLAQAQVRRVDAQGWSVGIGPWALVTLGLE